VQAIIDTAHVKIRVAQEQIGPPVDETSRVIFFAAMEAIRADTEQKLGRDPFRGRGRGGFGACAVSADAAEIRGAAVQEGVRE
jgi:hypothetical protein